MFAREKIGSILAPKPFEQLDVIEDSKFRSAAMNMAVDEALLETATQPVVRFYRWDHPALSFGYFGKYADVEGEAPKRDLVRRWTGGGIVLHGDDLTYSIVIPASVKLSAASAKTIYARVHEALRDALAENSVAAELAPVAAVYDRRNPNHSAVIDRRYSNACFANPVAADVMIDGCKVAGAAQRRTRRGLLQQGSIQQVELAQEFASKFAHNLSDDNRSAELDDSILHRAQEIADQRYGQASWLRRR